MIRHGLKKAELGLPADQRKALIRTLVTEVLRHGRITTTKVGQSSSWHYSPYSMQTLSCWDLCQSGGAGINAYTRAGRPGLLLGGDCVPVCVYTCEQE